MRLRLRQSITGNLYTAIAQTSPFIHRQKGFSIRFTGSGRAFIRRHGPPANAPFRSGGTGRFLEEFTTRAGFGPTQMAGYAYDSVAILAEAIAACGDDITRDEIRDNLAKKAAPLSGGTGRPPTLLSGLGEPYVLHMIPPEQPKIPCY